MNRIQMKKNYLFLSLITLLLISCGKDVDVFEPNPLPPAPSNVTASIFGIVTDETGDPVPGALVQLNSEIKTTNAFGTFYYKDRVMSSDAYVSVSKSGYFHGSRRYYPSEGKTTNVEIVLLDDTPVGMFESSNGGEVELEGGASITFPVDAVTFADGSAYSGTVQVSAKPLYTDDDYLFEKMPGDLVGINGDNQLRALGSFGMIAAELKSATGELLQIAEGKTARIEFPIVDDQRNTAPSQIPLWYFNEESGYWVEEGEATKLSDQYIAEVGHFSFWNCDAPFPLVELSGSIVIDGEFTSQSIVQVCITAPGLNVTRGASINQDGTFSGKVPKNEPLVLTIKTSDGCTEAIELYSGNIGPFSEDVELNPIEITLPPILNFMIITGDLVDCDGNPVEEGIAKVEYGESTYYVVTEEGSFSYGFFNCELLPITVTGFDYGNEKESLPVTLPNLLDLDFGTIEVCEALSNFISFEFATDTTIFIAPNARWNPNSGTITINGSGPDSTYIYMDIPGDISGTYNVTSSEASLNAGFGPWGTINSIEVIVTYVGGVGDFVTGTMNGVYEEYEAGTQNSMTFPFTGAFRIELE
jgi:hypothetical protein